MQSEEPRRKGSSQRRARGSALRIFSLPSLATGHFSIQRMLAAIGVETAVYRFEEGILQVNMARLILPRGASAACQAGSAAADEEGCTCIGAAQDAQHADGGINQC